MSATNSIAIIGAGPAGLIVASELKQAGITVTIFEQRDQLGGTWAIQPLSKVIDVRDGLTGVYSPAFPSLRCNLPKQALALPGFSFPKDTPLYPNHTVMLSLLQQFAEQKKLVDHIHFNQPFIKLAMSPSSRSDKRLWQVITASTESVFDGVVFCNSRYQHPNLPNLEPFTSFSGRLEHSLSYRGPGTYRNQRVAILGTGSSGEDLSREISQCAKRVYLCAHSGSRELYPPRWERYGASNNLTRHRDITACDGRTVILENNEQLRDIDVLILCTGYQADPILQNALPGVSLSGNKNGIAPLYLDLFHPLYPELMVTAMNFSCVPFVSYALQAKVIARTINREITLPGTVQRQFAADQQEIREKGEIPFLLRKELGMEQWKTLANMAGVEAPNEKIKQLLKTVREHRNKYPDHYRDLPWPG